MEEKKTKHEVVIVETGGMIQDQTEEKEAAEQSKSKEQNLLTLELVAIDTRDTPVFSNAFPRSRPTSTSEALHYVNHR